MVEPPAGAVFPGEWPWWSEVPINEIPGEVGTHIRLGSAPGVVVYMTSILAYSTAISFDVVRFSDGDDMSDPAESPWGDLRFWVTYADGSGTTRGGRRALSIRLGRLFSRGTAAPGSGAATCFGLCRHRARSLFAASRVRSPKLRSRSMRHCCWTLRRRASDSGNLRDEHLCPCARPLVWAAK